MATGSAALAVLAVSGCDPVEQAYVANGPYTPVVVADAGPGGAFSLYHPLELAPGDRQPVLTWGNGTYGFPAAYGDLLKHLASHGFVVVAAKTSFVTAADMVAGLDLLEQLDQDPSSALFDTLDMTRAGTLGHSRGGGAAVTAGSDPRVRCLAPIEGVPGEVEALTAPMLLLAGSEDATVPASWIRTSLFEPSSVPTTFATLQGGTHLTPLLTGGGFRGYLTAWFRACLADDAEAARAFPPDDCTLCENDRFAVETSGY